MDMNVRDPRPRVLLIEDDQAVRAATRMLLTIQGYAVIATACLGEALAWIGKRPDVDLILADYHLANGETGPQAIGALRRLLGRPVRAVIMTGDTSDELRGVIGDPHLRTVRKPVDADELLGILAGLLVQTDYA